jgi:hypothetical protein
MRLSAHVILNSHGCALHLEKITPAFAGQFLKGLFQVAMHDQVQSCHVVKFGQWRERVQGVKKSLN